MIVVKVKTESHFDRITKRSEQAAVEVFSKQATRIEEDAKASITESDSPSAPGTPPHTRGRSGHSLPESIASSVTKDGAIIVSQESVVGEIGAVMEFGETHKGQQFDIRAFMGPALERNVNRGLARDWYGVI